MIRNYYTKKLTLWHNEDEILIRKKGNRYSYKCDKDLFFDMIMLWIESKGIHKDNIIDTNIEDAIIHIFKHCKKDLTRTEL